LNRTVSSSSPLLDVRDLACEREDVRLFSHLSFQLAEGELLQIAGPNGVGKTSLLRLLCGLSYSAEGEIYWCGHSLNSSAAAQNYSRERVYLAHQNGLKPMLSASENLRWWLQLRNESAEPASINEALAQVGLAGYENFPCHQLSAGQQRRVALTRLLVSQARLWILDEPFNALDVAATQELMGWLHQFAQKGGAVIFTSHLQLPDLVTRVIDLKTYQSIAMQDFS
jgi:heme exporter protein A